MFNIGGLELLVIAAVALLVLGPDKLPKFMRTVGKAVGQIRRVSTEFQRTINLELTDDPGADAGKPLDAGSETRQDASFPHTPAAAGDKAVSKAPSAPRRRKLARPKSGASGGLARVPRRPGSSSKSGNGTERT